MTATMRRMFIRCGHAEEEAEEAGSELWQQGRNELGQSEAEVNIRSSALHALPHSAGVPLWW